MHPQSRAIIGQILNPRPGSSPEPVPVPSTPMTLEQIVRPTGGYSGPERRASGVIVAEVVEQPGAEPPLPQG